MQDVDQTYGLNRFLLAMFQTPIFIQSLRMLFRDNVCKTKLNALSHALKAVVESDDVHMDQRAIWTSWKVSVEELEETWGGDIEGVAMLRRFGMHNPE